MTHQSKTFKNQFHTEDLVIAAFKGILKREPDPEALTAYTLQIQNGEISLETLLSFFCSLDEFYDRATPSNRIHAISRLYTGNDFTPLGDSRIWQEHQGNVAVFHIPKCGGTSLINYFAGMYHPLQLGSLSERQVVNSLDIGKYQKFFAWHMDWSEYSALPQPLTSFLLMRRPEDRLTSLYYFLKFLGATASPPFDAAATAANTKQPMSDFFHSNNPRVINHVNNVFVRTLTGAYVQDDGFDPLKESEDHYVGLAKDRLNSFDCVLDIDAIHDKSLPQQGVEDFKKLTNGLYGKPCELELLEKLNSNPTSKREPIPRDFLAENCRLDKIVFEDQMR
jgi:Sulfotransferase family